MEHMVGWIASTDPTAPVVLAGECGVFCAVNSAFRRSCATLRSRSDPPTTDTPQGPEATPVNPAWQEQARAAHPPAPVDRRGVAVASIAQLCPGQPLPERERPEPQAVGYRGIGVRPHRSSDRDGPTRPRSKRPITNGLRIARRWTVHRRRGARCGLATGAARCGRAKSWSRRRRPPCGRPHSARPTPPPAWGRLCRHRAARAGVSLDCRVGSSRAGGDRGGDMEPTRPRPVPHGTARFRG